MVSISKKYITVPDNKSLREQVMLLVVSFRRVCLLITFMRSILYYVVTSYYLTSYYITFTVKSETLATVSRVFVDLLLRCLQWVFT